MNRSQAIKKLRRLAPQALIALSLAFLTLGLTVPWYWDHDQWRALAIPVDLIVLIAALWGTQWLRPSVGAPALGTGAVKVLAAMWTLLFVFEVVRQVGFATMGQDPNLYDAAALASHLFVLARDLYGIWAHAAVVAILITTASTLALATLAFAQLEPRLRAAQSNRTWPVLLIALIVGIVGSWVSQDRWPARWVWSDLAANAHQSYWLWQQTHAGVVSDAYAEIEKLQLEARPDVRIYIIESYGNVVQTDSQIEELWRPAVEALGEDVRELGWHSAAGRSTAPVSGGRSWIADADLLLGMHVAHQTRYTHLMQVADDIPHLPKFMKQQGYATVLVRPKDHERPGVKLNNFFRFDQTLFQLDLQYTGPTIGWGRIPDQYTIGFVEDEVIGKLEGPVFAFFHLVTAHLPWNTTTRVVDDWRTLQKGRGTRNPEVKERPTRSELRMHFRRYRRAETALPTRDADDNQRVHYTGQILYDLEAILEEVVARPVRRPTLMVLMGDHQPALLGRDLSFDVQVHVLATDPALLDEFIARGFVYGWVPDRSANPIRHESLFSMIARVLARADGITPPRYRRNGVSGMRE